MGPNQKSSGRAHLFRNAPVSRHVAWTVANPRVEPNGNAIIIAKPVSTGFPIGVGKGIGVDLARLGGGLGLPRSSLSSVWDDDEVEHEGAKISYRRWPR